MRKKRRASDEAPPYQGGKYRDYLFNVAEQYRAGLLTDEAIMEAIDVVILRCYQGTAEEWTHWQRVVDGIVVAGCYLPAGLRPEGQSWVRVQ